MAAKKMIKKTDAKESKPAGAAGAGTGRKPKPSAKPAGDKSPKKVAGVIMARVKDELLLTAYEKLRRSKKGESDPMLEDDADSAPIPEIVRRLQTHFTSQYKPEELAKCDCGGMSPSTYDACPFCGDADTVAADEDEPTVEVVPKGPPPVLLDAAPIPQDLIVAVGGRENIAREATLDLAVGRINELANDAVRAYGLAAAHIKFVFASDLWRQRRTDDGGQKYKTFKDWASAELTISYSWATRLRAAAEQFTTEQLEAIPMSKLTLTLALPPAERAPVIEAAAAGASRAQIGELVATLKEKEKTKSDPPVARLAFSMKAGVVELPMMQRPTDDAPIGSATDAAYSLADEPWCQEALPNGVTIHYTIMTDPEDGSVSLRIERRRTRESDLLADDSDAG